MNGLGQFGKTLLYGVATLWILLLSLGVQAQEVCKPFKVIDGDTLYYRAAAGQEVRVRVAGFDAPERGQPYSDVAKARLRQLTEQGALCSCYKQDRHGRSVCTVRTLQGQNVATLMLRAGLGCIDPRFEHEAAVDDRASAREGLLDAQRAHRGMWAQSHVQCAFDYRRAKREHS